MNVLHYFLGPERAGGLNLYVRDLALAQLDAGHRVSFLCPGSGLGISPMAVRLARPWKSIPVWQILNPPPVVLLSGIRNPKQMMVKAQVIPAGTVSFLNAIHPDIVHIHTWMGFPAALLDVFREIGCPVIYSVHDYFGLCPKVNWIRANGELCSERSNAHCSACNYGAPSPAYLQLRNSPMLLRYAQTVTRWLPCFSRLKYSGTGTGTVKPVNAIEILNYHSLADFYQSLWAKVDLMLFNSNVTCEVFQKFCRFPARMIPITHAEIVDHRKIRNFNQNQTALRITVLGGLAPYKGFPMLKRVLTKLATDGCTNWRLAVYGDPQSGTDPDTSSIIYCGKYRLADLDSIFAETDLLVVPSICYETFGFVVSEALSRGVPALVSATVGARLLVEQVSPDFVVDSEAEWKRRLFNIILNRNILVEFNQKVCRMPWWGGMKEHSEKIESIYQELLDRIEQK